MDPIFPWQALLSSSSLVTLTPTSGAPASRASTGTLTNTGSALTGISIENSVMRRDLGDFIRVGDLHYVWYSKGPIPSGYDANVCHASSPDGRQWTEKDMALAKAPAGSRNTGSSFTPNILFNHVAEQRLYPTSRDTP